MDLYYIIPPEVDATVITIIASVAFIAIVAFFLMRKAFKEAVSWQEIKLRQQKEQQLSSMYHSLSDDKERIDYLQQHKPKIIGPKGLDPQWILYHNDHSMIVEFKADSFREVTDKAIRYLKQKECHHHWIAIKSDKDEMGSICLKCWSMSSEATSVLNAWHVTDHADC